MNPSPSGMEIDYSRAADLIEEIADSKAKQFRNIAWYDEDDIRQEVRIKCLHTLPKFDPSRSDLRTFLSRCAENRLRDIRRGVLFKDNKPCIRCPLWNPDAARRGEHDCNGFLDKMDCDKYAKHERYVQMKLSVGRPIKLDEDRLRDEDHEHDSAHSELMEFIDARLPDGFREDFDLFQKSSFDLKVLKPQRRINLVEVLTMIVQEYQEECFDE